MGQYRSTVFVVAIGILSHAVSVQATAQSLFVANESDGTIHQFSTSGTDLGVFKSGLSSPLNITLDTANNFYLVLALFADAVVVFAPAAVVTTIRPSENG